MAIYTPHICLDLVIGGITYTLSEGAIVYGLTYIEKGVEKCLTGAVRVINSSQNKVMAKQTCPPESYFEKNDDCCRYGSGDIQCVCSAVAGVDRPECAYR